MLKGTLQIFALVLSGYFAVSGQITALKPNQTETFTLEPNSAKEMSLALKENGFAALEWLAADDALLTFEILDGTGGVLERLGVDDWNTDTLYFVAPSTATYILKVKLEKTEESNRAQTVSVEYSDRFKPPPAARTKDSRVLSGYQIRILATKDTNYVVFEKGGVVRRVLSGGGGADYIGFSFPDKLTPKMTPKARMQAMLLRDNVDKTGDGVDDIMIDYYSGGAHCCFQHYFVNLGERADLVEKISAGHIGIAPLSKNPLGGLTFETADNSWAYWPDGFAGSPFPTVILDFKKNKLKPNFTKMKKPPPSLSVLRQKAFKARSQLSNLPYYGEDSDQPSSLFNDQSKDFSNPFYSVMLDLMYTGNEDVAWQFFDLVWPPSKAGKQIFKKQFQERLSASMYSER